MVADADCFLAHLGKLAASPLGENYQDALLKKMLQTALQMQSYRQHDLELWNIIGECMSKSGCLFNQLVEKITTHTGQCLFIHFDEIGSLALNSKLRSHFVDATSTSGTEVYYNFWGSLISTLKVPTAIVYASGKGAGLSIIGHGQSFSPGEMIHLMMEPLKREHVMEILESPAYPTERFGSEPVCKQFFKLEPEADRETIGKFAELIAEVSGGIPRLMRFALAGVWSERVEPKLEDFDGGRGTPEYRRIVDAAVIGIEQCPDWQQYNGLSERMKLLDPGKQLGFAAFSGRIYKKTDCLNVKANEQTTKIPVAKIASDMGYYMEPIGKDHFRLILPQLFFVAMFEALVKCFKDSLPEQLSRQESGLVDGIIFETGLGDALGFSMCLAIFEASRKLQEGRLRDALPDLKCVDGAAARLGEIKLRWEQPVKEPQEVFVTMTRLRRTIKDPKPRMSARSLNECLSTRAGTSTMSYADFGRELAEWIPGVVSGESEASSGFRIIRAGPLSESPDVLLLAWDDSTVGLIGFQAKALEARTPWPMKAYEKNQKEMKALGDAVKAAFEKEGHRGVLTGAVLVGTHLELPEDLEEELKDQPLDETLVWQDAWAVGEKKDPSFPCSTTTFIRLSCIHPRSLLPSIA